MLLCVISVTLLLLLVDARIRDQILARPAWLRKNFGGAGLRIQRPILRESSCMPSLPPPPSPLLDILSARQEFAQFRTLGALKPWWCRPCLVHSLNDIQACSKTKLLHVFACTHAKSYKITRCCEAVVHYTGVLAPRMVAFACAHLGWPVDLAWKNSFENVDDLRTLAGPNLRPAHWFGRERRGIWQRAAGGFARALVLVSAADPLEFLRCPFVGHQKGGVVNLRFIISSIALYTNTPSCLGQWSATYLLNLRETSAKYKLLVY